MMKTIKLIVVLALFILLGCAKDKDIHYHIEYQVKNNTSVDLAFFRDFVYYISKGETATVAERFNSKEDVPPSQEFTRISISEFRNNSVGYIQEPINDQRWERAEIKLDYTDQITIAYTLTLTDQDLIR